MHCETDSLLRQKRFIELSIAKVKQLNLICLRFIRPAASLSSSAHIALPRPKALLRMSLFIYLLWTLLGSATLPLLLLRSQQPTRLSTRPATHSAPAQYPICIALQ